MSIVARQSPATKLRFDANGKWHDASALSQFSRVFAFPQLEFLEQPLAATKPNDEFIFALPPPLSAKIALDESLRDPWRVPDAWAGVAVVKPLLAGDFAKIRAWLSRQCGARFVISTVFESDVGRAALRFLIAENRHNKRRLASGISRA
ncbi:MAG: hypothetical protein LUD39_02405 [Opitutae bacterium]|nr:hypothetical protein [Opitutae bacterium]